MTELVSVHDEDCYRCPIRLCLVRWNPRHAFFFEDPEGFPAVPDSEKWPMGTVIPHIEPID
jgi:hypothetical protein